MVLSLQLAHRLENKNVLLVGGGEVSLTRIEKLVPTGCKITLIAIDIHADILNRYAPFVKADDSSDITNPNWDEAHGKEVHRIIRTPFKDEYFHLYNQDPQAVSVNSGWAMILTCIPDRKVSEHVYAESKRLFGDQQLVNVADNPPYCDFYFGANLNVPELNHKTDSQQPLLQLLISSNGASPRFTALVRDKIAELLEQFDIEESVLKLGDLRKQIRVLSEKYIQEKNEDSALVLKYRMQWIKKCTDIFGLQNCARINVPKLVALYSEMYLSSKSLNFPEQVAMLHDYVTGTNDSL